MTARRNLAPRNLALRHEVTQREPERKHTEEAQAMLAAIVDSSDDPIISCSLDRTILTWNAAAERVFGYAAAEVIGRDSLLLIPADQEAEAALRVALLKDGIRVPTYEAMRLAKDGRRIDVSCTLSSISSGPISRRLRR